MAEGVHQQGGEQPLGIGRQLAPDGAPGGRRRQPVELVDLARDRIGAIRVGSARPGPADTAQDYPLWLR